MPTDLHSTLSALLVHLNMSFHWNDELNQWWLVKENSPDQEARSPYFQADNLYSAKRAAYVYLKLLCQKTHPFG
jgi:hypothetical protein